MICFYTKMKSIIRAFLICVIAQLLLVNSISALELKTRNEYLFDTRGDDGDIYLNHLSLHKKIDALDIDMHGFCEAQWNFETEEWEKVLLGLGAKKYLWKYLFIGQSVQFVSGAILDHMTFDVSNKSAETTTKIGVKIPLVKNLSLKAWEEYSFNLEEFESGYAESIAEIKYSPEDASYSIDIGWRHTDRIHNFDTDYATASFTLRF